jgi:hypothetical protein
MVNEDITCGYNAMIFSKLGCPTECQTPSTSGHLCNGHGICDYDTSQSVARCFCDTNWVGHHCFEQGSTGLPPKQSYAGNIAGGFFGGIFTGLALVAIWGFVLSKVRWRVHLTPHAALCYIFAFHAETRGIFLRGLLRNFRRGFWRLLSCSCARRGHGGLRLPRKGGSSSPVWLLRTSFLG